MLRQCLDSLVQFGDRLRQLLLPRLMCGRFELPLQLGAGEAVGLELAYLLGIAEHRPLLRLLALLFQFVHALLDARIGVDQSFSSITHVVSVRMKGDLSIIPA